MIPVIDLFAGPGGLGEGFASVLSSKATSCFDISLSIEKEKHAFETLKLRTFCRQHGGNISKDYYRFLRGELKLEQLYEYHPNEAVIANNKCWNAELGSQKISLESVRDRISQSLKNYENWVLIGGPPCQAYSVVGRVKNRSNPDYIPENDIRQRLYVEYLQIIGDFWPSVFIMENVKGMLSATLENVGIFERILEDLRNPSLALQRAGRSTLCNRKHNYRLLSLVEDKAFENGQLDGAVIQSEKYGIPQARHRVILLGVRDDLGEIRPSVLKPQNEIAISEILGNLPVLRSGLSRIDDSGIAWSKCLRSQLSSRWVNAGTKKVSGDDLSQLLRITLSTIEPPEHDRGNEFIACEVSSKYAKNWYCDDRIGGICNHSSRSHMEKDLFRYIYAACYAQQFGKSPVLGEFPTDLLPEHLNVYEAIYSGTCFTDRFRVQLSNKPSTTVVSHISKDGHYYIHPDPRQCRSLTVREAARLQTFPDNYYFCGSRTSQYIQVGNAVPPLLAKQIGEKVFDLLNRAGILHG